jgi:hydrogenase maturation factor
VAEIEQYLGDTDGADIYNILFDEHGRPIVLAGLVAPRSFLKAVFVHLTQKITNCSQEKHSYGRFEQAQD